MIPRLDNTAITQAFCSPLTHLFIYKSYHMDLVCWDGSMLPQESVSKIMRQGRI